nr:immunoglobulin heavy chain junction region [Mus musculus]
CVRMAGYYGSLYYFDQW